jgi:katanin p80 WD40 repeat-containing subunit B1
VATFREHTGTINSIRQSPDGKWIASGASDGSLKIWDLRNSKLIENFDIPNQQVTCMEFNPCTLTLANGSTDRTVKYWDLENFSIISQTKADSSPISHLHFSELHSDHIFSVSRENLRLWNIENNKLLDCIAVPPRAVADFGITFVKKFLLLACIQSNTLSVYYTNLDSINTDEDVDTIPTNVAHE